MFMRSLAETTTAMSWGTYLSWNEYEALCVRAGLKVWLKANPHTESDVIARAETGRQKIRDGLTQFQDEHSAKLPGGRMAVVVDCVEDYLRRLDSVLLVATSKSSLQREEAIDALLVEYLMDQYQFCASRREPSRSPFQEAGWKRVKRLAKGMSHRLGLRRRRLTEVG